MAIMSPNIDPNRDTINQITKVGKQNISRWLKDGIHQEAIDFAEKFGYCLSMFYWDNPNKPKGLSTNQIRNVFGEVKRIEMALQKDEWDKEIETSFILLRPKMAYAAKRDKTVPAECLYKIVKASVESVSKQSTDADKKNQFVNFSKLFEAIVAYHRAFEKK